MCATRADRDTGRAAQGARWRARAFGLEIDAAFEAPGLAPAEGPPTGPVTTMDLVEPDELDAGWPSAGVERVLEERFDDGPAARTIDAHPRAGYRLYARHFGLARIAPDGSAILCAPPEDEPWSWQRFLVGRVLPWAALLSGREVLHASAVAIDRRAVAFVGGTGVGKTSLAVQLMLCGAGFVTDDVLAVDTAPDGRVVAYPGACIASVRPGERDLIPRAAWERLGVVLGDSVKTYVAVPGAGGPLPLGALCFMERADGPALEPLTGGSPRHLLGSTFVVGVQTPQRLVKQLDVCAAMARDVPLLRVRVGPDVRAEELATTLAGELPRWLR
jgi:hypothetical protein